MTRRAGIATGSDHVVAALRLSGGTARLVALVDAVEPALGRRGARAAVELARLGGRIVLAAGDDGQLVATVVEDEVRTSFEFPSCHVQPRDGGNDR